MRKKAYEKPTMCVVQLQHQSQILTASDPDTLSGHAQGESETEDTWYDLE